MNHVPPPEELDDDIRREAKALYRSIYRKLYFKKYYEKNQTELRKNALENYHRSRGRCGDGVASVEATEANEANEEPRAIRIERRPTTINLNLNSFYIKRDNG